MTKPPSTDRNARCVPSLALPLVLLLLVGPAGVATAPRAASATERPTVEVDHMDHLPPVPRWSGASEELMLDPGHEWATDFEKSGGTDSPDYAATSAWLQRLVDAAPELARFSLGRSPEGREIWGVIASSEGATSLEQVRRSDRPVVLAHSGIHSGEIDGKDAGLMLLRDMTVRGTKRALLDEVNLVFVPVFSVDGHERRGEHNRMNQHGPRHQGWRTNARNLNLNRDYTTARALEMRHMLRLIDTLDPELYVDLHVTDGADYQYDITYGSNGTHGWSPAVNGWLRGAYREAVDVELERMGHVPGPLIFTVDQFDITRGMFDWTAGPRFSNGYGDARHVPTILVENHSLKPYRQRVLGTYVYLEATLRAVGAHADGLRAAIAADRAARPAEVHLGYERSPEPLGTIDFLAIDHGTEISPISGRPVVRYDARPFTVEIPIFGNAVRAPVVRRPAAYWIPAAWSHLAEWLDLHGIAYETLERERTVEVERLHLPDAEIEDAPYEGQVRVRSGEPRSERVTLHYRAGALRVPTDQDLGTLAMILLEPQSPDGLFQWGFLLEILQRTEYFEAYVMEPMARAMLEADPELAAEFQQRLRSDREFAADGRARLDFFYERTPYYDEAYRVYPIAREID